MDGADNVEGAVVLSCALDDGEQRELERKVDELVEQLSQPLQVESASKSKLTRERQHAQTNTRTRCHVGMAASKEGQMSKRQPRVSRKRLSVAELAESKSSKTKHERGASESALQVVANSANELVNN